MSSEIIHTDDDMGLQICMVDGKEVRTVYGVELAPRAPRNIPRGYIRNRNSSCESEDGVPFPKDKTEVKTKKRGRRKLNPTDAAKHLEERKRRYAERQKLRSRLLKIYDSYLACGIDLVQYIECRKAVPPLATHIVWRGD